MNFLSIIKEFKSMNIKEKLTLFPCLIFTNIVFYILDIGLKHSEEKRARSKNLIINEIECPMCKSKYWYEYDDETTSVICKNKSCDYEISVDPFGVKNYI